MSATATNTHSELDDILYQSVVDHEFREMVIADPALFGLEASGDSLPAAIAPPDREILDLASASQGTCKTTCSHGVLTVICDGTTK